MWFLLLFKGILLGLLVSAPLGPVGVMCIQRTINKGLKSGVISGLGAASADTFYAIIAGLGIGFITNFVNQEKYWIQLIGSIIIMLMAVKIFYTNPAAEIRSQRHKKNKLLEDFLSVFFVTLTNPAVLFVFIGAYASFSMVDERSVILSTLMLIVGVFLGATGWWYILGNIINKFRHRIRLKNIWWLNKIMGIIVFVLGVIVILKLFI